LKCIKISEPEGKRQLGRSNYKLEDNIKMVLKEVGEDNMDWIYLVQQRNKLQAFANTLMDLWVP
jgi:hypothetical protein